MLHLKSISKQYGERVLFSDVSVFINHKDRIGLVGSNGAGKTTFLRIVCGSDAPDSGEIYKSNDIKIGYLPQEMEIDSEQTLINEASRTFEEVFTIESEIELIHRRLESFPEDEKLLQKLGNLEHELQVLDANNLTFKIERILNGLGFKEQDFQRRVNEFSGGWKMRLLLAKLLLSEPSVLLLDEPTNHLDLESLEWLEEYLNTFKGAIILVSHDKSFLNNLTQRTFEIASGKMTDYKGNFSFYIDEKEKRREVAVAAYKNQKDKIKQTEKFIERFRYKSTKAKQVQSRIKMLEKIDYIEIDDDENSIDFSFPNPPQSGRVVYNLENLKKSFNSIRVFDNLNLTIERGDRIAVVGPNGAGKSTLLKILAGIDQQIDGKLETGYNVIISYFAQEQTLELDTTKTILETIDDIAQGDIRKRIRTLLGSFLFSDDDVFKSVSILSGGEKSRVALAKMLLTPANFLIMDEPTNHLDIRSKEMLQKALQNYNGTYIIAAHDRDFLNPIINKVFEVKESDIKVFPGNLLEYLYHKKQNYLSNIDKREKESNENIDKKNLPLKEKKRLEAELRQKRYNLTKDIRDKIKKMEDEILYLEDRIKVMDGLLADPETYKDADKTKQLNLEYKDKKDSLQKIYDLWERQQSELEEIEKSVQI
jgi:ATP-binding cassette, subfamily F, member 3